MTAPRRIAQPLPEGARRAVVSISGEGWRQQYVLLLPEGREWQVTLAPNRIEAASVSRVKAKPELVAEFSTRLNAAPGPVKDAMRRWMRDRRVSLNGIVIPDLAAANAELAARLAELDEGVAGPVPDAVPDADMAVASDREPVPVEQGPATSRYADMQLGELVEELRARDVTGVFDDPDEIREFLEALDAEAVSASGETAE